MMKQLHFKHLLLALCLVATSAISTAQSVEISETLSKNAAVPGDVKIDFSNHSGDLNIKSTSDNNVSIETELKVVAKTQEEARKVIDAIKDFEFDLHGNIFKINTRFYKSMQSTNSKTTLTLLNGDKVRIKNYSIKHTLNIPESAAFELSNKYSDVQMENRSGKTTLNLYSSKLYAGDFDEQVKLESKYSKLQIGNLKASTSLELYDTDVELKTSTDLKVTSKYSKLEAEKTGSLNLESYDDKFYIDELPSLKMNAKYSDFKSESDLSTLNLELYDSNVSVGSAKAASFNGKYCDLNLGDVGSLKIDDSYDSDITLGKTGTIEFGRSKYSKYIMAENAGFSIDESYDDDVYIKKLAPDFKGIKINGKYGKLDINAGSVPFKLAVNQKYGKVNYPESMKPTKHIEKSGQIEIEAGESGSLISVEGYDNTIIIK